MLDNLKYYNINREKLREYSATPEQLAWARLSALEDGNGRGMRIIDVNNGSGLNFTVVPDRGLDVVEALYKGIPIAFRASAGYVNGAKYEADGFGWLRSWAGGLITTCGLRSVGPPNSCTNSLDKEHGLHGRISHQSAENLSIRQFWENGRYKIQVQGVLREAMFFSHNLKLEREITTYLGDNAIYLTDVVTNESAKSEVLQILYHCNFGFPAISPGAYLTANKHRVTPRDSEAEKGIDFWHQIGKPVPDYKEQCFLHEILPGEDELASIQLVNPNIELNAKLSWDTSTLPKMMQWKMSAPGEYALGLEPTNCSVSGRSSDIKSNKAQYIEPGQEIRFHVKLIF